MKSLKYLLLLGGLVFGTAAFLKATEKFPPPKKDVSPKKAGKKKAKKVIKSKLPGNLTSKNKTQNNADQKRRKS